MRCWGCWIANGWKWPSWAARPTKEFRTSITRTKSMGDSGSPCRSPRRWIILSLGSPFSSILVDEYEQDYCRRHSKWRQPCPKPIWMRTSRRKNQDTESKAFDMSNLRSLATVQLFSHLLHKHKVVLYVFLFFTKADWFAETNLGRRGAKRLAITLVTGLAKLWMRLIGLKSFRCWSNISS